MDQNENKRVIFMNDVGELGIIVPARHEDCGLTVEEIALKDTPTGRPFKIVDVSDIPEDRTNRGAWTVDLEDLTDGVGE